MLRFNVRRQRPGEIKRSYPDGPSSDLMNLKQCDLGKVPAAICVTGFGDNTGIKTCLPVRINVHFDIWVSTDAYICSPAQIVSQHPYKG